MKSLFYLVIANLLFVIAASNVSGQARGFLNLGSVTESDDDADGIIDSRTVTTNIYDIQGRLLQRVSVFLPITLTSPLGSYVSTTTYTWSKHSIVAFVTDYDLDADGQTDSRQTTTVTYPSRYETVEVTTYDNNFDGTNDSTEIDHYAFDKFGNFIQGTSESDGINDGIIDARYV